MLTREKKYIEVAESNLKSCWKYNAKDLSRPYWGATLDAGCEDKEAGSGFLHACLAVYEATDNKKYLNWAKDAANWLMTLIYLYDAGFKAGTPCHNRINTVGWTSVSVQNYHLDAWGNFIAPDFVKLGKFLKDKCYKDIGWMLFYATTQGIATKEYMWGYNTEGDQSEGFHQTNCYDWRGGHSHWHPSWIVASTLVAGTKLQNLNLP